MKLRRIYKTKVYKYPRVLLLFTFIYLISQSLYSQERKDSLSSFSLDAYKYELGHPIYLNLKYKINQGDTLSGNELEWFNLYNNYLKNSYQFYMKTGNTQFNSQYGYMVKDIDSLGNDYTKELIEKESQKINFNTTLIQHIVHSGYFGIYYGIAANQIFGFEDAVAFGVPFLISGGSMIYPIINYQKFTDISNNSLWLRSHGKFVGAIGGIALSALLFGEGFFDKYNYPENYNYSYDNNFEVNNKYKATFAISSISSIGLGSVGFKLGKTKDWTEGRVSLYRQYSLLNSAIGAAIVFSTGTENPRWYGASVLLSAASGYYLADKIANSNNFTKGDVIASTGFTMLNAGLGWGIFLDIMNRIDLLDYEALVYFPVSGGILGNYFGYRKLKNAQLTIQQGRRLNLAMVGGSLIGLGVAIILDLDEATPYYLLPYATGLLSYSLLLKHYKLNNYTSIQKKITEKINYQVEIMPQNIFINNMMAKKQPENIHSIGGGLPLLNFSMSF